MFKKIFISGLPMLVVFLFDNAVNNPMGWYERWWWFDIPMHLFGGFVAAWSLARFFVRYKKIIPLKPRAFEFFTLVSGTALVGILWEVYEFFISIILGVVTQPSVADTIADLMNDCFGAILFFVFFSAYFNSHRTVATR